MSVKNEDGACTTTFFRFFFFLCLKFLFNDKYCTKLEAKLLNLSIEKKTDNVSINLLLLSSGWYNLMIRIYDGLNPLNGGV